MSASETVAVVAPLREELAPFLRRLGLGAQASRLLLPSEKKAGETPALPARFYEGRLGSRRLVVGWTGDGWRVARAGLESLLANHDVSRLVILGVAGGLTPGLGVGSLAVAREVRDGDGVAPAPEWAEVPGARPAVFFSQRRIAVTAAEKTELARRLAGDGELEAVVDLETAVYARVAAAHGVPYTAIRAVSDGVDEDLPLDFNRFLDAGGRTRRARVALCALGRPWTVGRLLGLRSRISRCAEGLSDAALFVLREDL